MPTTSFGFDAFGLNNSAQLRGWLNFCFGFFFPQCVHGCILEIHCQGKILKYSTASTISDNSGVSMIPKPIVVHLILCRKYTKRFFSFFYFTGPEKAPKSIAADHRFCTMEPTGFNFGKYFVNEKLLGKFRKISPA